MATKKAQRIRMRIHDHSVKHDGTLVEFAPDGSWFDVNFDGPLPRKRFYQYNKQLVTDKPPIQNSGGRGKSLASDAELWEVL